MVAIDNLRIFAFRMIAANGVDRRRFEIFRGCDRLSIAWISGHNFTTKITFIARRAASIGLSNPLCRNADKTFRVTSVEIIFGCFYK